MIIKLNNKDIHGAIRGLLQDQNIIDSYTDIETTITVGRGKNAGVSAEVTILDKSTDSTITKEEFEKGLNQYPEIKDKIEYLVDWDEDNYLSSMKEADVLLGWQFPTKNIREIAPNLKWIHVSSAGVNHLSPFDWMKKDLILTNSSGVHAKKAGEFGLMSILMLQNQMTKIVTNQKNKEFVTLLSKPIDGFKVVVVGTGSLGGSMIKHISKLGAEVIGVNRKGNEVEGCSKVITFDKIDEVLPVADFLYLAVPETEETKGLINKVRLDSLKPTCGIVNIGRQSVMDYDALSEKLKKNLCFVKKTKKTCKV